MLCILTSTVRDSLFLCFNTYFHFGVTAQWGTVHFVCRLMLTLRVGLWMMMRCHPDEPAMMRWSPVHIPPEVSSLADEVALQVARLHTSTMQEGKRRLPSVAVARLRAMTFWQ